MVTVYPTDEDGQDLCAYIDSAAGQALAYVFFYRDLSVRDANARLIAAAPDLLALLQELINIEGPQPGTAEWADKARAVIAKVAGEAS